MHLPSFFARKPEPQAVLQPRPKRMNHGLDIDAAIISHENWVTRLEAMCAGRSQEQLDTETLCQDHLCIIGKWLYGDESKALSDLPLVVDLKNTHKRFHTGAASIVTLCQQKKHDKAQQAMESHLHALSRRIRYRLEALREIDSNQH